MRKLFIFAALLALVSALVLTGAAAQNPLMVTDGSAARGQTVFLTVSLTETTVGNAVGITYNYDAAVVKPLPASCSWKISGMIQDFGTRKDAGAWTAVNAMDLKGNICVLAFQILPETKVTETTVTCAVIVKNGVDKVGEYTAQATIKLACEHQYGDWESNGSFGHVRVCSICDSRQSQTHNWDAGKITRDPNDAAMELHTFTCTVCHEEKVSRVPAGMEDQSTVPVITAPEETQPTRPEEETTKPRETRPSYEDETRPVETRPNSAGTEPSYTRPSGSHQTTDPSEGPSGTKPSGSNDHNQNDQSGDPQNSVTAPEHDQNTGANIPTHDHDHDTVGGTTAHVHTHEEESPSANAGERLAAAIGMFVVLALFLGAAVFFSRKKR